uniref:Uncharacterized protein n=1 Tax=Anguilla anguilla TaxID=7936 RepID=A0A0E9WW97_ANGAN
MPDLYTNLHSLRAPVVGTNGTNQVMLLIPKFNMHEIAQPCDYRKLYSITK